MEEKKEQPNFCMLCGKYTDDELKPVTVGVINYVQPPGVTRIPVIVPACPKCDVVMSNANRMYQDAKTEFQKKAEAMLQERKILVPGLQLPDDFAKKLKS